MEEEEAGKHAGVAFSWIGARFKAMNRATTADNLMGDNGEDPASCTLQVISSTLQVIGSTITNKCGQGGGGELFEDVEGGLVVEVDALEEHMFP
jgi:hypothetical protein